ncbi:MAG TPA: iron chelate uptake ABC transporter family permease subunit [Candidatus Krumholzibacteria bacterium]|nr:iron chelate uptake ABC transporter family permease subunit [Candidatus Krumholzibacteria bacterium]
MIELLSYHFVQMAVLAVLILAGIHAYLGYHVVSRGVIFVDLSLAQVSALGATIAFCLGVRGGLPTYIISLLFTLAGAMVISVARTRDERVPPEAFIGILYAAAGSFPLLLLSHHAEGSEMLHHMIAGSLLTVSHQELLKITILYAVMGVFFYRYRARFNLISTDRPAAAARGWKLVWWDFLFYAAFAVVVTSSVAIAGVLLVFSLLVIPPVCALLVTSSTRQRLALGWGIAGAGSLIGILASVAMDLPAGPTVITALASILLLTVLGRTIARRA